MNRTRVAIFISTLLAAAPALAQGTNQTSSHPAADVRSREATQATSGSPGAASNVEELKQQERNAAPIPEGAPAR